MSIKRSVLYNTILQVSQILFPLITFPYVSRVLGPEGFGTINFATNLSGLFISLVSLGVPLYGIREVARVVNNKIEIKQVLSELFNLHALYSFLGLGIYCFIIYSLPKFDNQQNIFLLGGLVIFFNCLGVEWLYQGLEQFKFIAIRTLIIRVLSIICLFLFVTTKDDLISYMIIIVFAQFSNGVINYLYAGKIIGFKLKGLNYKRHMRNLILLYGSSLAIAVYVQMDTVMLGFLSTQRDVGLYSATIRISKLPLAIVTALSTTFIPRISLFFRDMDLTKINIIINTSLLLISVYSIPVSFGMFLYAKELLLLFSGGSFLDAEISLRISSFLTFVIGFSNLFGLQVLTSAKKDKALLKSVLLGTSVNFILNLILIPIWGFIGATIATAIAEIIVTISTFLMVKYYLGEIKFNFSVIIPSILACLPFIAIKYVIRSIEFSGFVFIVQIGICVIIYIIILWLYRRDVMSLSNLKNIFNE